MTGIAKYRSGKRPLASVIFHRLLVVFGAVLMTLTFFLVLPIIQAINEPPDKDKKIYNLSEAELPTPPAPPEEEEIIPEDPEPEPEDLTQDEQLLSLDDLQLALSGDLGGGWSTGGFGQVKLPSLTDGSGGDDASFAPGALDSDPRATYRHPPSMNGAIRAKIRSGDATVWIAFIVDENGKVISPRVLSSPDRVFNGPALAAIQKWRFEPGRSGGKAVKRPMKVPITFQRASS